MSFNLLSHSSLTAGWASGLWMMHWERCGRNCLWSIWRHFPRIYSEELKKPTKPHQRSWLSYRKSNLIHPECETVYPNYVSWIRQSGFNLFGLRNDIFLQSKVVRLASNTQPGAQGLCIYGSQWQGDPVILSGTRFTSLRLLRLAKLQWRYSNSPPDGDICIFFSFGATAPIWALAYLHETLRSLRLTRA
jgi:hypothetical protein